MKKIFLQLIEKTRFLLVCCLILFPVNANAIQMHSGSEGIIVHQLGHLFFLLSMVMLIFAIRGKDLHKRKSWLLLQYSAFFFILWNLAALAGHFLDNQIRLIRIDDISLGSIKLTAENNIQALSYFYYILKLDHLLCVPAIILLYKGLSRLTKEEKQ